MIIITNLLVLLAFNYVLWRQETSFKGLLIAGLVTKMIAGVVLGLIYLHYYESGDTLSFFQWGIEMAGTCTSGLGDYFTTLWRPVPEDSAWTGLGMRTVFMIKVVSFFVLITEGSYWVTSLYFSLLSFLGAWYFFKSMSQCFPKLVVPTALSVLFFPSTVFWSSGIIKESLAMGCLFYLTGLLVRIIARQNISIYHLPIAFLTGIILWSLKYYFVALFIPISISVISAELISTRLKREGLVLKLGLFLVILAIGVSTMPLLHPNFDPNSFLQLVVDNHDAYAATSRDDSMVHYNSLNPTIWSFLRNTPAAIVALLFRPFPWEAEGTLQVLATLENVALLMLFLIVALQLTKLKVGSQHRLLIVGCVTYCLLLGLFLALSTPNFGTLSRYRVGFLPFLLILLFSGSQTVLQRLNVLTWLKK